MADKINPNDGGASAIGVGLGKVMDSVYTNLFGAGGNAARKTGDLSKVKASDAGVVAANALPITKLKGLKAAGGFLSKAGSGTAKITGKSANPLPSFRDDAAKILSQKKGEAVFNSTKGDPFAKPKAPDFSKLGEATSSKKVPLSNKMGPGAKSRDTRLAVENTSRNAANEAASRDRLSRVPYPDNSISNATKRSNMEQSAKKAAEKAAYDKSPEGMKENARKKSENNSTYWKTQESKIAQEKAQAARDEARLYPPLPPKQANPNASAASSKLTPPKPPTASKVTPKPGTPAKGGVAIPLPLVPKEPKKAPQPKVLPRTAAPKKGK